MKNVLLILHLCVSTCLGLHSLCYRRGEELKWFSPSVFIYLASVVPAIWVLELDAKRNEILCIYVDIVENTHDANREAMLMDLMQVRRTEYKFCRIEAIHILHYL